MRAKAREQLKGRWGVAILTCFIYVVIVSIVNAIPYIGGLAVFLMSGAFALGLVVFFLNFPRGGKPEVVQLFSGFDRFWPAFGLAFMVGLFTLLWTLLLIVPGIIAAYRYSQVFFIMNDNPNIGIMDAIRASSEMMQGQKVKLFLLQLSFIWWFLLCLVTLGIGFLWLYPYVMTATANFYEDLKRASIPGNTSLV
nr:DUF975 family protein [Paenibacillus hamazuiensis]